MENIEDEWMNDGDSMESSSTYSFNFFNDDMDNETFLDHDENKSKHKSKHKLKNGDVSPSLEFDMFGQNYSDTVQLYIGNENQSVCCVTSYQDRRIGLYLKMCMAVALIVLIVSLIALLFTQLDYINEYIQKT